MPHCTSPNRSERAVIVQFIDDSCHTYRECDARCSASHLSLIQPSVRAFTPPSTRILEMITAALSTTTAPTISSIWVLDLAPRRATRTVSIGRAPRCSLPHRARLARCLFFSLSAVVRWAQMHCIRCAYGLGNSAVQRRSLHLQHAARIHRGHRRHCQGLGGVYRRRYSDDESDGGHPRRGTGNPVAQLAGP